MDISFLLNETVYKTQEICCLYYSNKKFLLGFSRKASHYRFQINFCGKRRAGNTCFCAHLSMLGKSNTVFVLVFKTGCHTTEEGMRGRQAGQRAELTTQSSVSLSYWDTALYFFLFSMVFFSLCIQQGGTISKVYLGLLECEIRLP